MARPLMPARYRVHFGFVYMVLAAVLGAAIATTVLLVTRPARARPPAWSSWKPAGGAVDARVDQIRSFVSQHYRLPSGDELVGVRATRPMVQNQPIPAFFIQSSTGLSTGYDVVRADSSLMFSMCGLGPNCSIAEGSPTRARFRTLRREALELALYTFKYVDGIKSVVVFPPPSPKKDPTYVLFFRRDDLKPELSRPLRATLPRDDTIIPGLTPRSENTTVDALTGSRVFTFEFRRDPQGEPLLVLAPIA